MLVMRPWHFVQVPRLQGAVRDRRANWDQSIAVLRAAKAAGAQVTKTSIMLGCGEHQQEVIQAMHLLRQAGAPHLFTVAIIMSSYAGILKRVCAKEFSVGLQSPSLLGPLCLLPVGVYACASSAKTRICKGLAVQPHVSATHPASSPCLCKCTPCSGGWHCKHRRRLHGLLAAFNCRWHGG